MHSSFSLTILGSGTGVPRKERHAPGLVVQGGSTKVLLDSGSGAAYQLARAGFSYYEFDHLFYTHYAHPDHINDLPELIFANTYFDPPRTRELYVYGPKGIKDFFDNLLRLYPVLAQGRYPIGVNELEETQVAAGELVVRSRPMNHQHVPAVGYRIDYQGKSIIYSGDTDYCEGLIELARGGDVLVVECSFPDGYKVQGHLTPGDIGAISTRAKIGKVVLTHLYPLCDQFDVVSQVKKSFAGEVIRAEDLMRIEV